MAFRQKRWWVTLIVLVALMGGFFGWRLYRRATAEEYRTFQRPDGHYRLVVYRMPNLFAMPGGAGDAPGYVRLYDQSGRILQEQDVEMVQLVQRVSWENGKVTIPLIAEWNLPR